MSLEKPPLSRVRFQLPGAPSPRVELPPPQTRWVASRKRAVVAAIRRGQIARAEARARYALSEEELCTWEEAPETRFR